MGVKDVVEGGVKGILGSFGNIVSKFKADPTKVAELEVDLKQLDVEGQRLGVEVDKALAQDRESARRMYDKDSSLQKIFALMFLGGYLTVSGFLIYAIFFSDKFKGMENWEVALVSTVFTAMSTKVNTICDFLFGGSKSGDDSSRSISKILKIKKEETT